MIPPAPDNFLPLGHSGGQSQTSKNPSLNVLNLHISYSQAHLPIIYNIHYHQGVLYLNQLGEHYSNWKEKLEIGAEASLTRLDRFSPARHPTTMAPLSSPYKVGMQGINRHRSASPLPPPPQLPPKAIDLNSSTRSTDQASGQKITRRAFICDVVVENEGEGTSACCL